MVPVRSDGLLSLLSSSRDGGGGGGVFDPLKWTYDGALERFFELFGSTERGI